jgi:hypothetical protein
MRRTRWPLHSRLAWLAWALLLAAAPGQAQMRDADMKAAYVVNFAQFTSWPEAGRDSALTVCVDRASALGAALQAYHGRRPGGRAWQVLDSAGRPGPGGCDLLVLARAAAHAGADAPGVLVVRDGAGAPAAITLIDADEHLQFDVDTREVARAGLRLSSKLLRLARNLQ